MSLLLWCLCSCSSSDSYPGLVYDRGERGELGNLESSDLAPILLFTRNPFYINVNGTRSTGAYDPTEWYDAAMREGHTFNVYAFRAGREDNPPLDYEPNLRRTFRDDASNGDCLVDATVNGDNLSQGLQARLGSTDGAEGWLEGLERVTRSSDGEEVTVPLYYSTTHQQTGYNFFVYRIDEDFQHERHISREDSRIYYDVEIDGGQDIMCGVSQDLTMEGVKAALNYTDADLKGSVLTEVQNILDFGYSTYSAHRGIHPIVPVKHCLTRLKFFAYPGAENADNIVINSISVESKYKGRLVVASRDKSEVGITFADEKKALQLGARNASGKLEPASGIEVEKFDKSLGGSGVAGWLHQASKQVGESLLLAPDTLYAMTISYSEMRDVGNGRKVAANNLTARYTLQPPASSLERYFKEGYVYNINVAVFGSEKIQVMVGIEGWIEEKDSVVVEPDFE